MRKRREWARAPKWPCGAGTTRVQAGAGQLFFDAIHEAGLRRWLILPEPFRQFTRLLPMAMSLGFGIVVATVVILVIVPCFYLIPEDGLSTIGAHSV